MAFNEAEYARRRAEQRAQSSWFKLKEGENCFRILPVPPTETVKTNFLEYAVHREVGPKKVTVRCGIDPVSGEGDCWLCDVKIPQLKKKKMDTRAKALESRAQLLMQVAKVDDDGKMTGPFLFTPAKGVGDQLLASIFGSRKRSYLDPKRGFNINISRTGTGKLDTKYGIIEPDQDPSAVPSKIIDAVKPFDALKEVPHYSQAKQQAAYTGQEMPADEEEEEDEGKSARARTRRHAVEEEEEIDADSEDGEQVADDEDEVDEPAADEEEGEIADDEDEEPAPKPKTKPGKKPAAEPEEEEEEPAPKPKAKPGKRQAEPEDEDEEPAPKPKAKPGGKKAVDPEDEDEELVDEADDIDLDELENSEDADVPADDEDEEPAPKPKAKPAAKPATKPSSLPKPKTRR